MTRTTSLALTRRPHAPQLRVHQLENRTVPAFAAPSAFPATSNAIDPAQGGNVLVADFDGDSRLDLAVLDAGSESVSVLLGDGDGTFQSAVVSSTPGLFPVFAAGDFDDDGLADIVVRHSNSGLEFFVSVYFGVGDGSFAAPVQHGLPDSDWTINGTLATADFNGDGFDDFLLSQHIGGFFDFTAEINAFLSAGDRTFSATNSPIGGELFNPHFLLPADFNEDGHLDVVAGSQGSGYGIHFGSGNGTFGEWDGSVLAEVIGDFNNDGHLDGGQNMFRVQFGDGAGAFGNEVFLNTGSSGAPPVAGEFNGDGISDVVGLNGQPGVTVLLGAAAGPLGPYFNLTAPTGLGSVAVGDFNGDGLDDFAATDSAFGVVKVFLNDGNWTGGTMPPPPSISISDVTVAEGNNGTQSANFILSLSGGWTQPLTVQFQTAGGSAATGSDFQFTGGTVTFNPGQTVQTIAIPVIGDRSPESTESFFVNLSSPMNATIADGQGVGTIVDNEPRISINDVWLTEGNSGTKLFTFTVTLSTAYDQAVTVSFRTLNGTATSSGNRADYLAQTGTLTFNPSQTQKTISIGVKGDRKRESEETFFVELFGNGSNSLIVRTRGTGFILNDD